jgi:hypothetical protein
MSNAVAVLAVDCRCGRTRRCQLKGARRRARDAESGVSLVGSRYASDQGFLTKQLKGEEEEGEGKREKGSERRAGREGSEGEEEGAGEIEVRERE